MAGTAKTWDARMRNRLAEIDAALAPLNEQLAPLLAERAEIAKMLGNRRQSDPDALERLRATFADGQEHRLAAAMEHAGYRTRTAAQGGNRYAKLLGLTRVRRGVYVKGSTSTEAG